MNSTIPLLQLKDVCVFYGGIQALKDLNFEIFTGEIVSLIGANGAGKTTTLKAISGLLKLRQGEIFFHDKKISHLAAHQIVQQRICHAPEGRGIFLNLSVEENLDLGAYTAPNPKTLTDDLESVFALFPRLKERRKQNSGTLSGGEQQMLAIARALMGHPELLLLDEPSLGLAPQMIERIFEIIQTINQKGKTILLVEQNALQALQIANRGIILETGKIVAQGLAKNLLGSEEIHKAYLGD